VSPCQAVFPSTQICSVAEELSYNSFDEWFSQSGYHEEVKAILFNAWCAAIKFAAKEADHWQEISQDGHACGLYIGGAIRGLADKN